MCKALNSEGFYTCSPVITLTFFTIFEQGVLHFYFVLNLENYVAGPVVNAKSWYLTVEIKREKQILELLQQNNKHLIDYEEHVKIKLQILLSGRMVVIPKGNTAEKIV